MSELNGTELLALFRMQFELESEFGIESDGVLIRNGDARFSAGSIQHLHIHVIVPNGEGRVESPFYKGPKSDAEGFERGMAFLKLMQGSTPEQLSEREQELVKGRI